MEKILLNIWMVKDTKYFSNTRDQMEAWKRMKKSQGNAKNIWQPEVRKNGMEWSRIPVGLRGLFA